MLEFKSLNPETGMLEDIEEVRQVGIELADLLGLVLQNPLVQRLIPPDVLRDIAAFAVKAESVLRFMSQRELYLKTAQAMGVPARAAEEVERTWGRLSDTLPATNPLVRDRLLQNVLDSPDVPEDLKQEAIAAYQLGEAQIRNLQPPPTLPPEVEKFLRDLGDRQGG